jgi:hypothetical protein
LTKSGAKLKKLEICWPIPYTNSEQMTKMKKIDFGVNI